MLKKIIVLSLSLSLIVAIAMPASAFAPDWKLVTRIKGTVESQKTQEAGWSAIWQARLLQDGDKARTLQSSRAEIRLADDSKVTVGENTTVELSKFQLTPQSRFTQLKLLAGKIRCSVKKFFGKESRFEVTTPNGVLAARGTEFFVEQYEKTEAMGEEEELLGQYVPPGGTSVIVFFGAVTVQTSGQTYTLYAGQSAFLAPTGEIIINPFNFNPSGVPIYQGEPPAANQTDIDLASYDVEYNPPPPPPPPPTFPGGTAHHGTESGTPPPPVIPPPQSGNLPVNINSGTGNLPIQVK
jgi:hypothetical protein